jgi:predicted transcriptional regulator
MEILMNDLFSRLSPEQRDIINAHCMQVPVKIGAIANELGLRVTAATLSPGISGEIRRAHDKDGSPYYTARINRHESRERQRFTLAHEIGHYLLHREHIGDGISDDILYRSKLSSNQEIEANRFAAELLMPRNIIKKIIEENRNSTVDIECISADFGVSKEAMSIRLGI